MVLTIFVKSRLGQKVIGKMLDHFSRHKIDLVFTCSINLQIENFVTAKNNVSPKTSKWNFLRQNENSKASKIYVLTSKNGRAFPFALKSYKNNNNNYITKNENLEAAFVYKIINLKHNKAVDGGTP